MNNNTEALYLKSLESRYDNDYETRNKLMGLEGELIVNKTLENINYVVYAHNLEFTVDKKFQVDFLIVHNNQISILEVKHYYGDFHFFNSYMQSSSNNTYPLPFMQLSIAKNNLQKLCNEININLPIQKYLIFSNPTFTAQSTIPNKSQVLLRSEFYKFSKLFQSFQVAKDKAILNQILQKQKRVSQQFKSIEKPDFSLIKKGIKCPNCKNLNTMVVEKRKKVTTCICCEKDFKRNELYYFNIRELAVIKGEEGFTLAEAMEWCDAENIYTIRRVCNKYFESKGQRYKKYTLKENEIAKEVL